MKPWPTVQDVATHLRVQLATLSPTEQAALTTALESAHAEGRIVPEWRTAPEIPENVWAAVVGLAALDFRIANATQGFDSTEGDQGAIGSSRWRLLAQMGRGRGGRPRVG